ncbi:hypothetical protein REG_1856 [Candidatus Regiella insecticola LSR1]|uniref:Uncharacterized protein n=1 Tax=Candidatus Regiella insecticola LSR1 TaxID=663321 RepID=E0WUS1_9ENTR|nr:hypothetical protein [Candidatus Regiella insecticola]EFL91246.1 hypothetical protein REG_1856 [Candidatus Regiella insecticola LSR1]
MNNSEMTEPRFVYEHVPENVNQTVVKTNLRLCLDKVWPAENSENLSYGVGESDKFWRTGETLRIKFMTAYAGSAYVRKKFDTMQMNGLNMPIWNLHGCL